MADKFGIEFELSSHTEESRNFMEAMGWNRHNDASIHGASPIEIVSEPLVFNNVNIKKVVNFSRILCDASCETNSTCGLHLHFSSTTLNWQRTKAIWSFMRRCGDRAILGMQDTAERRLGRNRFCIPLDNGVPPERIETIDSNKSLFLVWYMSVIGDGTRPPGTPQPHTQKYNLTRYQSTNLHSLWYRGTTEFIHMSGTVDPDTVSCWIRLMHRIYSGDWIDDKNAHTVSDAGGDLDRKLADFFHTLRLDKELYKFCRERCSIAPSSKVPKRLEVEPAATIYEPIPGTDDSMPGRNDVVIHIPAKMKFGVCNHDTARRNIRDMENAATVSRNEAWRTARYVTTSVNGINFRIPIPTRDEQQNPAGGF